ncbi:MAG TPA: amidohydrolase family protein [Steroidobacteraceae bacterium]|jgi:imidazolonepropionase-like amidohydrolase
MTEEQHIGTTIYGRVIDGLNPPIENGAVAFKGERILWVGEAGAMPAGYAQRDFRQIRLPGRSVLPGLIDGHTHISFGEARSEEELALYTPVEYRTLKAGMNAKRILQAGVTSAFDAATTYNIAPCIRDAIDVGMIEGPRFAVSGRQLTTHQGLEDSFPNEMQFPPGQAAVLIKTKEDLIEAIRYQVKDRVDCIKVSGSSDSLITPDSLDGSALTVEELTIIATEARRLGVMSSVHARSRDSVIGAAKAGFDVIFHASYIDEEGIDLCLKNGCVIIPTLTLLINIVNANHGQAGASGVGAFSNEIEAARVGLAKAWRAGVPMIAGSESGWSAVPYGQWHGHEMQVFVELLGMTPLQAIHCATLGATRILRRFGHEVGKLEANRLADIIVVNGDPTRDISVLQKKGLLDFVFKGGVEVDRKPLPVPRRWYFEKHKVFLNGTFNYDESSNGGVVVR